MPVLAILDLGGFMKQSGQVIGKTNSKKLTVKLDSLMPSDKYMITFSILEPKDYDRELVADVPSETKEIDQFVIVFNKKLPHKTTIVYTVEMT